MESLGSYLRELREEKGLTVEDIHIKTKIPTSSIQKIEDNKFNELGGYGYAKATTLSYGNFFGANQHKIMQYLKDYFHIHEEIRTTAPKLDYDSEKKILIPVQWFFYLFLLILTIILGLTLYNFYEKGLLRFPTDKAKQEKVETKEKKTTKEKVENKEEKKSIEKKKTVKQEPKKEKNKPKKENVKIVVSGSAKQEKDESYLKDTTDYVDKLIFEGKDSPLNPDID